MFGDSCPIDHTDTGGAIYSISGATPLGQFHPEKVRYKVIGGEMKGMESSMKLVALGATQRKG